MLVAMDLSADLHLDALALGDFESDSGGPESGRFRHSRRSLLSWNDFLASSMTAPMYG